MTSFAHGTGSSTTTLSQLVGVYKSVLPDNFFGCYAYATQSGFRAFELAIGKDFWTSTSSRWLFGFDYGRTDPRALREIAKRDNTDIRIFDGAWVVNQDRFLPRRDFHPKVAMFENASTKNFGMVLGSGNFSSTACVGAWKPGPHTLLRQNNILRAVSPPLEMYSKHFGALRPLLWMCWTTTNCVKRPIRLNRTRKAGVHGSARYLLDRGGLCNEK